MMSFKPRPVDSLQRVRRLIQRFPETKEKLSHGAPTWWGGAKTFATFHNGHYHDGVPAIWIKAPPGAQQALIETAPSRFYRPKYFGPSGWVALRLNGNTDWKEVEALLLQGYRMVAPKRAIQLLDAP